MNGLTMLKVTSVIVISAVLVCPIREGNTATGEDNATVRDSFTGLHEFRCLIRGDGY